MAIAVPERSLYHALKAEGFELPPECINVQIEFHVDDAPRIIYTCFMTETQLDLYARALARIAQELKRLR